MNAKAQARKGERNRKVTPYLCVFAPSRLGVKSFLVGGDRHLRSQSPLPLAPSSIRCPIDPLQLCWQGRRMESDMAIMDAASLIRKNVFL